MGNRAVLPLAGLQGLNEARTRRQRRLLEPAYCCRVDNSLCILPSHVAHYSLNMEPMEPVPIPFRISSCDCMTYDGDFSVFCYSEDATPAGALLPI